MSESPRKPYSNLPQTQYLYSMIILCPDVHLNAARALATALGHQPPGGKTLSTPLSPEGVDPPTHHGSQMAARQGLLDLLTAGVPPPGIDWSAHGTSFEAVQAAISAFVWDHQPRDQEAPGVHFARVAQVAGLAPVVPVNLLQTFDNINQSEPDDP